MVRRLATGKLREFAKLQNEHGVLLPLLHENMLEAFGPNLDRRADLMHPSDMSHGDWCPRAEYYKLTGVPMPEEKFNRVLENIFDEGYEIQYKWQRRMRATRKLWGRWLCQLCGADELGLEPDRRPANGSPARRRAVRRGRAAGGRAPTRRRNAMERTARPR